MNRDFEKLAHQIAFIARILRLLYRGVTGEELDLESGIRHRPLLSVGVAAAAGAALGWWLAERQQPRLPSPPEPTPLDYLNEFIPGGLDRVREALPASREEAIGNARTWLDTVLEPRLKEGLESVAENVPEDRLRGFLMDAARRLGNGNGPDEHEVEEEPRG